METRRLIANWKLNLPPEGIDDFVGATGAADSGVEIGIAPPYPFLQRVFELAAHAAAHLRVGAQNCAVESSGAFTGEVSVDMIRAVGGDFVIVGHSERRAIFGESSEIVGRKAKLASEAGLQPVVCIGEEAEARQEGRTRRVLEEQLRGFVQGYGSLPDQILLAYEPVWAIGTGNVATPEIAGETHAMIRDLLRELGDGTASIIYGGSVNPENAGALSSTPGIDGFLVGGASLSSSRFLGIASEMASSR